MFLRQFNGREDIEHVAMPADSELCFAAGIAAVSGATINEAHEALSAADISEIDGSTSPNELLSQETITVAGKTVTIEPVETPMEGTGISEGIWASILEQLDADKPVALLTQHSRADGSEFSHWTVLSGYWKVDGEIDAISVMDPKEADIDDVNPDDIRTLIDRSLPLPGAYVYALGVAPEDESH